MTKTVELEVVVSHPAIAVVPSLPDRSTRILAYHNSCIRAFGQQMGYAFLCGLELNAAKTEIAHGAFTKWREKHLAALPERTAQLYMSFTSALIERSKPVAALSSPDFLNSKLLTNGDLDDAHRNELLKAVYEATDGKTLTEMYRELGVIRAPKRQQYTPPQDRTPEELLAAEKADALDHVDSTHRSTRTSSTLHLLGNDRR
jgi:hypothetical protein